MTLTFGSARQVLMHLGFKEFVEGTTRVYEDGYGTIIVLSGEPASTNTQLTSEMLLRLLETAGIARDVVRAALEQL